MHFVVVFYLSPCVHVRSRCDFLNFCLTFSPLILLAMFSPTDQVQMYRTKNPNSFFFLSLSLDNLEIHVQVALDWLFLTWFKTIHDLYKTCR